MDKNEASTGGDAAARSAIAGSAGGPAGSAAGGGGSSSGGAAAAGDDAPGESTSNVLSSCLDRFASPDFIMEPEIFTQLKTYFQAGGNPEQVIDLLSKSYVAVAQMANLMAEWLILAGAEISVVRQQVEQHLHDVILKTFDPKKADAIFAEEGETPSWLAELIEYPTWRSLIYRLAEDFPDCLMLNFTIKLISDAGFQGEITSISTAAQQIEVFSRILKTSVTNFLNSPEDQVQKNMEDCAKMVCHGQHTYVYAQVLLSVLAHEKSGHVVRRLQEEIYREAQKSDHDVTPITMALLAGFQHTRAAMALGSMLSRNTLNPADIVVLYKLYSQSSEPPPVELIRIPAFLELLIDTLFKPNSKINQEHKSKYIFLLAYAASVCDTWNYKRGTRKQLNKDELKGTTQAAEKVHSILSTSKGSTELIAELNTLYQCIRFPVVSVGIIRWVECVVSEPNFFSLSTDYCRPVQLALLDEVVTCHPLLHQKVLQLYIDLFEKHYESLEILAHLEIKKMLIDRLVNLLSRGYVIPVVNYMKNCWEKTDTDVSLIRYFVTEVLDTIAPPYSLEFVQLFLPLVENEEIVGGVRREGDEDPVSEFVVHCRANYTLA